MRRRQSSSSSSNGSSTEESPAVRLAARQERSPPFNPEARSPSSPPSGADDLSKRDLQPIDATNYSSGDRNLASSALPTGAIGDRVAKTASESNPADQPTFTRYFESEIRELEHSLRHQDSLLGPSELASKFDVTRQQYNGRLRGMDFCHIDDEGKALCRQLSRTDVLLEARLGFGDELPNAKKVGSWLVDVDSAPREFQKRFGSKFGRKSDKKLLKTYLKSALRLRDIRQVDSAFSAQSCLWVRHSALVVSMEDVRAIICYDKVFLFDPDSDKSRSTQFILQQRIQRDSDVEDAFVPFELRALEGILISVVTGLEADFVAIEPLLESTLQELPRRLNSPALEDLRVHQQTLTHFMSRAEKVQRVLQEVLDDDEDMSKMYLTEKQKNPDRDRKDHDEVEALLEAYMQVVDDLTTRAELLDHSIEDTEDLVGIHLDTLRNKLLMVQLSLGIIGMMLTFGSLVAGFFGMNLEIPIFESANSEWWFAGVVIATLMVVGGASFGIHVFLRRLGLYTPV